MAMPSAIGDITGRLTANVFGSILWFGIILLLIGVVGFLIYWFAVYRKKFDIKVKVISRRAGEENSIFFDKAAILKDRKTNTRYFRIWGMKRELPVPKYNILQRTNEGDLLEIYRKSEEEFFFLMPPKIDNARIMRADGRVYPFADQKMIQVDPEIGFWMAKRMEQNKSMFSPDNLLMKILPFIPHIIGGVITIFILYVLMDHLPAILGQLRELAAEINRNTNAEVITGFLPIIFTKWWKK